MIVNVSGIWELAIEVHATFLEDIINAGLLTLNGSELNDKLYDFIISNRAIIVRGEPGELEECIEDYMQRFKYKLERKRAAEKLKELFDYASFSQKSEKLWSAYQLCSLAIYKVCCYCNLVATDTCLPDEDNKGYRPPIDHYYGKAEYPFLALTLSNFIPCCEKCNGSQMKGVIDFSKIPHLHPLIDDESIDFDLVSTNPASNSIAEFATLNMYKDEYRLALNIGANAEKAAQSIKTFQLSSRYNHYSGAAYRLAKVMRGVASRLEMHNDTFEFDVSIADYLGFEPDEYKNTPYGKVGVCIAEKFGRLKT
ncbi:UNVERIFIED_ORG: hypothetical protein J2W16_001928 [Pseudomonas cremoricolorata]|nr:hypothetical protein [Pseudomonas cremoricolorata]